MKLKKVMTNKEKLIDYLQNNPKTESWQELAEKFNLKSGEAARSIWKNYRFTNNESDNKTTPNTVTKVKKWQLPSGEWRESVTFENKDNDRLQEFKNFKELLLKEIQSLSKKDSFNFKTNTKDNPVAVEISLPDFHLGKMTGESIEDQVKLYLETVGTLVGRVHNYNIEKFILPIGNDLVNSEGKRATTTKGTPQQDNADWMDTFTLAWKMIVSSVEFLKTIAPVEVIVVSGNHAWEREFYIGEVISAFYYNSDLVKVNNSKEPRKYTVYGKNLIGFTHGDCEKPFELPLIMATEVPVEFSQTKFREWHTGHIHKHMVDEFRGIAVKFLPSICGEDAWHKMMGYSAMRKAQAYIYNKETGPEGYIQVNYE